MFAPVKNGNTVAYALKYTLPALCATALWMTLSFPALAQGTVRKPTTLALKPTTANANVAGSVNGVVITWNQLIDRLQKDSPEAFNQVVGQAVGTEAATTLFGPNPKSRVILTRSQVVSALKRQPASPLTGELTSLLREEAIRQQAAKEGLPPITNAQVDAQITQLLQQAREQGAIPPGVSDQAYLAARHINRERLRANVRTQMMAFALMDKDLDKTLGHPLGPNDYLQARHILIAVPEPGPSTTPDAGKKADADALAKANQIDADIRSGKIKFEDAAKQDSADPGSKDKGGDLGPFMRGMMVKEFENTAFSLKPGEVSNPVRSQFGYHIIRVDKLGKDLTPAERQKVLDRYNQDPNHIGPFLQDLMTRRVKVVNNLQAAPPMGMMRPGMGGRPAMVPPGAPRPVPAPQPSGGNR